MTRRTHRLLIFIAQSAVVIGLGAATLWNILGALTPTIIPIGWWGLLLPLPGLLLWIGTLIAPDLLARMTPLPDQAFRLVYTTPDDWHDDTVRAALRNLAQAVGGIGITWARDGDGIGCWVTVPANGADILHRMAQDIFPTGYFEPDNPPLPTTGVAVLGWKDRAPSPPELCRLDGVNGVYIFWQDARRAIVSVWGPRAAFSMWALSAKTDLLPGTAGDLVRPRFRGQNPYPDFPPFPPSGGNPGLSAVSDFEKTEPALRITPPGLILGLDPAGKTVGFNTALDGVHLAWFIGEYSAVLTADIVRQALSHNLRVFLFDGTGAVITRLIKTAMRELASGRALLCDLDRPAQTKFRLNPLWLPAETQWQPGTVRAWQQWLAEIGITPAGLGQVTVQHTIVAVTLIAFAAQERGLLFDPVSLRDTLNTPDILPALRLPEGILDPEIRQWWQHTGRHTSNFDAHLRLSHLRDRLTQWLTIPEYRVLWQTPYDNPVALLEQRTALFWRVPDPTGFRRAYINSQLMALTNLLRTLPAGEPPAAVILHGLNPGFWGERLHALPGVRLLAADIDGKKIPDSIRPQTLVISRLNRSAATHLSSVLNIRESDLRRLPAGRLIIKKGKKMGTVDMNHG